MLQATMPTSGPLRDPVCRTEQLLGSWPLEHIDSHCQTIRLKSCKLT